MAINKGRRRWVCKPCGKTAFGSESRALETLGWAVHRGRGKIPVRVYPCPKGNGYHLTSQEARV